ncbi:glycosyltransferase family 39 protein [Asticcacaulis sp.]|uniref:ArnT family glycosyltransferase n=1 Tax=Asticcacaulis sp. TaxID=1872648 RepID=UPI0031D72F8C
MPTAASRSQPLVWPDLNLSLRDRPLTLLLVVTLVARLVAAATMPLTIDEAYAVVVSRSHALSYFDHPPLAFALARFMADATGAELAFAMRLPFLVLGMISLWLIYDLTRNAFGRGPALWAAIWFAISPFFGLAAGTFILPDGPLDTTLLICARCLLPFLWRPGERPGVLIWAAAGAALGLAVLSKYQTALFAASLMVLFLTTRRGRACLHWLYTPAALSGAALIALPVLVWNAEHHWASLAFQAGRAGGHGLQPGNFAAMLLGQALYVGPVASFIAMRSLTTALRTPLPHPPAVFGWLAIVPLAAFAMISLFSVHSLPHWAMNGWLFTFPLIGQWTDRSLRHGRPLGRWALASALILAGLSALYVAQARDAILTRYLASREPAGGVAWQSMDWTSLTPYLESETGLIVTPNWVQAARVGAVLKGHQRFRTLADPQHHFPYMGGPPATKGMFVGAVTFGEESDQLSDYEAGLAYDYKIEGPPEWLVIQRQGFPSFKLVLMPVSLKPLSMTRTGPASGSGDAGA